MYHNGKKVSERVEEMIIVNIDLKDKEFEKRLGELSELLDFKDLLKIKIL